MLSRAPSSFVLLPCDQTEPSLLQHGDGVPERPAVPTHPRHLPHPALRARQEQLR